MRTPASPKQHDEHRKWLLEIDFYTDQIKIFRKELTLVLENQHADQYSIFEHIDEYRKILRKKEKLLADLRERIILHERIIASEVDEWDLDPIEHTDMKNRMLELEQSFEKLKGTLRRFVAKHQ